MIQLAEPAPRVVVVLENGEVQSIHGCCAAGIELLVIDVDELKRDGNGRHELNAIVGSALAITSELPFDYVTEIRGAEYD